ncbi:MAG: hypothetical protein CM15mP102_18800 [Flavobacteriales bacterium]|nr:MAG: hypothetical protein CM15mP102_18800 [Flavobacteriales bacterium]
MIDIPNIFENIDISQTAFSDKSGFRLLIQNSLMD